MLDSRAAEDLYAAFADVPRPARLEGCPCCVEPGEGRALLDRPLRDLTAEDLARYGAKALNTWAGEEEFRYFAPRLLELAAAGAFAVLDPEIVFIKLARAGWAEWPQRDAVEGFLGAFWTRTLESHPSRPAIGTALCALGGAAGAAGEMAPYLDEWGRLASEAAIRQLHEFAVEELAWRRGTPLLRNAYWDTSGAPYREVLGWLTGGPAAEAVRVAFERAGREDVLELLADLENRCR
ncbi:hypothetical protein [Spirillospora sp. NPDC029432]|uniref:hypothetical protein n=1 Tax=Spirillospora sp. NPDC029432 TaxID=3154599 RepID=UPI0034515DF0